MVSMSMSSSLSPMSGANFPPMNPGRFGPIPVRSGCFGPISGVSRFGPVRAGHFGPI